MLCCYVLWLNYRIHDAHQEGEVYKVTGWLQNCSKSTSKMLPSIAFHISLKSNNNLIVKYPCLEVKTSFNGFYCCWTSGGSSTSLKTKKSIKLPPLLSRKWAQVHLCMKRSVAYIFSIRKVLMGKWVVITIKKKKKENKHILIERIQSKYLRFHVTHCQITKCFLKCTENWSFWGEELQ